MTTIVDLTDLMTGDTWQNRDAIADRLRRDWLHDRTDSPARLTDKIRTLNRDGKIRDMVYMLQVVASRESVVIMTETLR